MATISIDTLETELSVVVRRVEGGETIVVTREGEPVLDIAPHRREARKGGLDFAAGEVFLRAKGITDPFPFVANDFDEPLDEDFLIRPLPE